MQRPYLAALLSVLAFLTACSAGGFEPEPLEQRAVQEEDVAAAAEAPAATEPTPTSVPRDIPELEIMPDDLVDGPLTAEQYTLVTDWFDSFLSTRDLYFVGQASGGDMAGYVSDRAFLAEMAEFQFEYGKLLDEESFLATTDFASFSNITSASSSRGVITFTDCTEQQSLSTLEIVGFRWITNRVVLRYLDGKWTMVEFAIEHDGEPWTPGFGCSPSSFNDRATAVVESLMTDFQRFQREPSSMPADAFATVGEPAYRNLFTGVIERQLDEDIVVVSPEELSYEVQGLDVAGSLVDWAIVVDACARLPEGLSTRNVATDEITREPTIEDGFGLNYRFVVSLETVEAGAPATDQVSYIEVLDSPC